MAIGSGVLFPGVAENPTFPILSALAYTTGLGYRPTCDIEISKPSASMHLTRVSKGFSYAKSSEKPVLPHTFRINLEIIRRTKNSGEDLAQSLVRGGELAQKNSFAVPEIAKFRGTTQ